MLTVLGNEFFLIMWAEACDMMAADPSEYRHKRYPKVNFSSHPLFDAIEFTPEQGKYVEGLPASGLADAAEAVACREERGKSLGRHYKESMISRDDPYPTRQMIALEMIINREGIAMLNRFNRYATKQMEATCA